MLSAELLPEPLPGAIERPQTAGDLSMGSEETGEWSHGFGEADRGSDRRHQSPSEIAAEEGPEEER